MHGRYSQPLRGADRLVEPGMVDQLRLAWRLLRDPRVTGLKYLVPALLALYVGSPVDPIPDFLLGLGQMDDVGVVILGVLMLCRLLPLLAPKEVVAEHARDLAGSARTNADTARVVDARFTVRD
jgi:uncharacterized membrane protein YkvA (DUF1232 family)